MTHRISARRAAPWLSFASALLVAAPAPAADAPAVIETRTLEAPVLPPGSAPPRWEVRPVLVVMARSRWSDSQALAALREAAAIFAQCGVRVAGATLHRVDGPERYADFSTPVARELAQRLPFARPTVYFVRDTRQRVPFEAEAIGRGNSATRPELAFTVWLTQTVRDPGVALAHELAHVLMDSGEHVDLPGNLMRDQTAPDGIELTAGQCARLTATGAALGLLVPSGE